jgi:nitrate reductase cytochrome c-type subunit
MDQLSSDNVPTRSLDSFESKSLAQLWADEDVVVSHEGNEYRMLGSLRAARQCLECHSVQRGELLGAFSYSLRRNLAEEEHVSLRK